MPIDKIEHDISNLKVIVGDRIFDYDMALDCATSLEASDEYIDVNKTFNFDPVGTLECTLNCDVSPWLRYYLSGYFSFILYYCPNKSVVHRAKFAKKRRIRKKNFNYAVNILRKHLEKGGIL